MEHNAKIIEIMSLKTLCEKAGCRMLQCLIICSFQTHGWMHMYTHTRPGRWQPLGGHVMGGLYFHSTYPLKIISLFSLANLTKANFFIKVCTVCFYFRQTSLQASPHTLLSPKSGKTDKAAGCYSLFSSQTFRWPYTKNLNQPWILEPGLWGRPLSAPSLTPPMCSGSQCLARLTP